MRTTAFWTLYVGITILIGSVCHYHTAVEGRPGKSPAGKTVGKYLKVFPPKLSRIETIIHIIYIHKIFCLMFETVFVLFIDVGN